MLGNPVVPVPGARVVGDTRLATLFWSTCCAPWMLGSAFPALAWMALVGACATVGEGVGAGVCIAPVLVNCFIICSACVNGFRDVVETFEAAGTTGAGVAAEG